MTTKPSAAGYYSASVAVGQAIVFRRLSSFPASGLVLLAFLTASAAALDPQETVLQIDPGQTQVEFTLGAVLHTVHGTFRLKRGEMRFDAASGSASGELVVDAASAESGNQARDKNMRQAVLESGRYPEIVFRPERIVGKVAAQGASQVRLDGVFSIHGAEHELEMPAEVEAGGGQYRATVRFTVPFVEWGMKDPSTLFLRVEKHVDITIRTVAKAAK
jgi:polyisoprenoid-binding protein YceI